MRKIGLFPILLIFFVGVSCNNEATETSENDFVFDSTERCFVLGKILSLLPAQYRVCGRKTPETL